MNPENDGRSSPELALNTLFIFSDFMQADCSPGLYKLISLESLASHPCLNWRYFIVCWMLIAPDDPTHDLLFLPYLLTIVIYRSCLIDTFIRQPE
jgi:hypothetical protein